MHAEGYFLETPAHPLVPAGPRSSRARPGRGAGGGGGLRPLPHRPGLCGRLGAAAPRATPGPRPRGDRHGGGRRAPASSTCRKPVLVPAVLPCGECDFCRAGRGNACPHQKMPGNDIHGGFSSHMMVPAAPLVPLDGAPEGFPLDDLSVVADAVSTAYQAALRADLCAGDLAVVVGAGGVGGFLVQIARALGARVVACDVKPRGAGDGEDLRRRDDDRGRRPRRQGGPPRGPGTRAGVAGAVAAAQAVRDQRHARRARRWPSASSTAPRPWSRSATRRRRSRCAFRT